jgi:hypothetical protein
VVGAGGAVLKIDEPALARYVMNAMLAVVSQAWPHGFSEKTPEPNYVRLAAPAAQLVQI